MLHSHTKIWIHIIWGVKYRQRLFNDETRRIVAEHLAEKAKTEGIPFIALHVQPEHVHGLLNLPSDVCLKDFVQKIKGESSHWLNDTRLLNTKMAWQRGYGAFSVSASQFEIVKRYIHNQDRHHQERQSFPAEYAEWKAQYGIVDDDEDDGA